MLGNHAVTKLLNDFNFNTVLDIGGGQGKQAKAFADAGKTVTIVDLGLSKYARAFVDDNRIKLIRGDFNLINFNQQYDLIWASHILEHQKNVGLFIDKIKSVCKPNGIICITVPPKKDSVVGGHLTIWNAGLLMYNLVVAGIDCSQVHIKKLGYNISVIVKNIPFEIPTNLSYDVGDIQKLSKYFPKDFNFHGFNGDIREYNWNNE